MDTTLLCFGGLGIILIFQRFNIIRVFVIHAFNPITLHQQEDPEFEGFLGYLVIFSLKKIKTLIYTLFYLNYGEN